MRPPLLSIVLLVSALHVHAQGSPEEQAISEMLTAKDSALVEKHLPEQLRTALDAMSKVGREELLSRPRAAVREKGLKVSENCDGLSLIGFDAEDPNAEIKHFEIRARRRISNGAEAVLVLSMVAPEKSWGNTEVWMKWEQGEWRITEFTDPNGETINLEDPETIAEIAPTPLQANEHIALATLQTLVRALVIYRFRYSEMPDRIEQLGTSAESMPDKHHGFFIDSELATRHIQSGYKFEYQRTSLHSFEIKASPLQFGKSGSRNFFVDNSRVIRFTNEDREATVNDGELQERLMPGVG